MNSDRRRSETLDTILTKQQTLTISSIDPKKEQAILVGLWVWAWSGNCLLMWCCDQSGDLTDLGEIRDFVRRLCSASRTATQRYESISQLTRDLERENSVLTNQVAESAAEKKRSQDELDEARAQRSVLQAEVDSLRQAQNAAQVRELEQGQELESARALLVVERKSKKEIAEELAYVREQLAERERNGELLSDQSAKGMAEIEGLREQ